MKYAMPPKNRRIQVINQILESLDDRSFQLYAEYVRRHGQPRGSVSTLSPDCRIRMGGASHRLVPR